MKGYVYILTNECMPGLVKIGRTTGDPEARAAQLHQTGVPVAFKVAYSVLCPDCVSLEAELHDHMPDVRVSSNREFFRVEVSVASGLLDDLLRSQVETWLEEFIPGQSIVKADLACDEGDIAFLAYQLGEPAPVIVSALSEIRPDEISPAIKRYYNRAARWSVEAGS